jgi:hypothetical protein
MTAPLRAILFTDRRAHREARVSGSIWISEAEAGEAASMWFFCPCGCGALARITIGHRFKPKQQGPSWNWNGNRTDPTLHPSVNNLGGPPCTGWHGWLRDGYWEVC